ncbi:MAG: cation transporter [Chloroflexi bacterium]|nr:cation transporter [Chloroflexota bacterium]
MHGHEQHSSRVPARRSLFIALVITLVYLVAEVIGGLWTHSLALLADAGHMLTDVASLSLALFAIWLATRPAPAEKTYGYYRTEILAALANGASLVVIAVIIFYEAFRRIGQPPEVNSLPMLLVATVGLGANLLSAYVLFRSRADSLNLRGAFLHVAADALGSVGAIIAGVIMLTTGWYLADPLVSIGIGLLILFSSWNLLRESVDVLMEAVPVSVDLAELTHAVEADPQVADLHDLHVWTVTSGFYALSAHVVVGEGCYDVTASQALLERLRTMLRERFDVEHSTLQLEWTDLEDWCETGS